MNKTLLTIISVVLAFASQHLNAHHSFASTFDYDETLSVEGVVTRFSFRNPHVNIFFDVENEEGSITTWLAEGESATMLRREGWANDSISAGERIRVTGNSTLDGSPMVSIQSAAVINPATGAIARVLSGEVDESPEAAAATFVPLERPLSLQDGRPNLSGVWHGDGSPYARLRDPDMPFNDAGRTFQATYNEINDPQVFCQRPGLIRQAGMTHYGIRITQAEDQVVLEYEEYGNRRVIYFDDRAALGVHSHFGDSVARYENDRLIIETTNLLPNMATAEGNRLSDQTRVVQTFERADQPGYGAIMEMITTTTDPVYLEEEFVLVNGKVAVEDQPFIENDCTPPLRDREEVHPFMSFFITSEGPGDGANLGGLEGADAHCAALASEVGQGDKNWRAYLSTTGENGVDARDRIGSGPWYNSEGELIAVNIEQLHTENWLSRATVLDQRGRPIESIESNAQDDGINSRHDVLTGSTLEGTALVSDSDTTCSNWTSNGEGSALIGHFDRRGGGQNPTSWNSAHQTRGCSSHLLATSDGEGLYYCFATEE